MTEIERLKDELSKATTPEKLRAFLDQYPPKEWVKELKWVGVDGAANCVRYLPIDKVEFLLRLIYGEYKIEVKSVQEILGGVVAAVRVYYLRRAEFSSEQSVLPLPKEWSYHDGVGAITLTRKWILTTAAPAAVSFAIKDAMDHGGNLFGAYLNLPEPQTAAEPKLSKYDKMRIEIDELMETCSDKIAPDQMAYVNIILRENEVSSYPKLLEMLKQIKS